MNMKAAVLGLLLVGLLSIAVPAADQPRTDNFGIFDVPRDARAFQSVKALGVGWMRAQLPLGDPNSERKLQKLLGDMEALNNQGVGLWLTLYHRDRSNSIETGTVGYSKAHRGGFPVRNHVLYRQWIQSIIKQFTNVLKSAGRTPSRWLVVQFGNEVLPRDVAPPDRAVRFWHGTAEEYLAMLESGYRAVKAVDRNIAVASAGISSAAMEYVLQAANPVSEWNRRLLTEGRADWVDIHLRHSVDDVAAKLRWTRTYWNGPIASTELSGPDPRVEEWTAEKQYRDLTERISIAQENGVSRIFWSALIDRPGGEVVYDNEGLLYENGEKKPAYGAYRALVFGRSVPAFNVFSSCRSNRAARC